MGTQELESIRQALIISPDNLSLRMMYAKGLLNAYFYDEAAREFAALSEIQPTDTDVKAGLAAAYIGSGKPTAALIIYEELYKSTTLNGEQLIAFARLLLKDDQREEAEAVYIKATQSNPIIRDAELDAFFGGKKPVRAEADNSVYTAEIPGVTFSAVGGMDEVKEEIRLKIIHPVKFPELYKSYGKNAGGGILLYGPPGCGKTFIARATAGEVNMQFICVGISDVLDMYVGGSERRLHDIFQLARQNKPCVLFFDEVDALAANRAMMMPAAGTKVINQFLAEMDGASADNDQILILGATNAPWHLDAAFKRPGRFDNIIFIGPPDELARREILKIILRDRMTEGVDVAKVASVTSEFSGADLRGIIDTATEVKLRDAIKSGRSEPLRTDDLLRAVTATKPSTREWFSHARNYALYGNESGLYNGVLKYLKHYKYL